MPEIIEVKTYTDFIRSKILNKTLSDIVIKNGRYFKKGPFEGYKDLNSKLHSKSNDISFKVIKVDSKGKFMYISFGNPKETSFSLGFTLGLSGGWFFQPSKTKKLIHGLNYGNDLTHSGPSDLKYSLENEERYSGYMKNALNHINVEFKFTTGTLMFYDTLSFGTIKIFNETELQKKLKSLGSDIMDPDYKFSDFYTHINIRRNLNKPIGNVLMDQKVISGIGNYLRADCLWMSKISPFRKVKDVSEAELKTLFHNVRVLIWGEYNRKEGERLKIITKKDKTPSSYKRDFFVYREEKDINGYPVIQEPLFEGSQKRFIYWVKQIQH
jgi:formamidopyrimidine-DNA glycosylase